MGRWINRDPIGENGGLNLYGAFANDPVNKYDEYGLVIPIVVGVAMVAIVVLYPQPANTPTSKTDPVYKEDEYPTATDRYGADATTVLGKTYYGPTWRKKHPVERESISVHEKVHRDRRIRDLNPFRERETEAYQKEKAWNEERLRHLPKNHPDRKHHEQNIRDCDMFLRDPKVGLE